MSTTTSSFQSKADGTRVTTYTWAETPAQPLPAGTYQVKWNAVSVDTHKSAGDYSFTVSN